MSGEFTPQLVADLQRRVRQAVPRWNLPPKVPQQVLSVSENVTLLMGEPNQPRATLRLRPMTLRLHRSGYHTAAEITSELAWIQALRADKVVETPAPRLARDGQALQVIPDRTSPTGSRHAVAFDWVPGHNPDPAEHDLVPWFTTLGQLTARLHRHARHWVRPSTFVRKSWTVDSILGPHATWGPWQSALGLTADGADTLALACALIAQRLEHYGQDQQRFGLIHGDLRLANLLVDGERLQVIDFDDCGFSWFLFDFAAAISFHECNPAAAQWFAAWAKGYGQNLPLSADDLAIIPSLVMMRRIQLTAWLASHHEIPLAQDLGSGFTDDTVTMATAYLNPKGTDPAWPW